MQTSHESAIIIVLFLPMLPCPVLDPLLPKTHSFIHLLSKAGAIQTPR
jgi:hypothetical protein